ncbi:MAG: hypothetical protein ACW99A_02900 [Candidatus Kariarchaeaceae archaeon]|jgi:hypothetical protein
MRKKIVIGIMLVGLLIPVFFAIQRTDAKIDQRAVRGNIVPTPHLVEGYFPQTDLTIDLTNLTTTKYYGLLIGANQNRTDYQWFNFTATAQNVEIKTVHFRDQSTAGYIDPDAPETYLPNIEQLRLNLYGILDDNDTDPNLLDSYWLKVRYYDEQLPDTALPTMLSVVIIMGALTGIFLTVFKYFRN